MSFDADETTSIKEAGSEVLETGGPSHRIGLSGANRRMLHLLKKAKVQLIKIDQQKQLKLSQVRDHFLAIKKIRKYNIIKNNQISKIHSVLVQRLYLFFLSVKV